MDPIHTTRLRHATLLFTLAASFTWTTMQAQTWNWVQYGGDANDDRTWSVAGDANGNVLATGYFYGTLILGDDTLVAPGTFQNPDIWLAMFDPSGAPVWARRFGGDEHDTGQKILLLPNGDIYLMGQFGGTVQLGDTVIYAPDSIGPICGGFVARLDPNGEPIRAQVFSLASHSMNGGDMAVDPFGNLHVLAGFDTDGSLNIEVQKWDPDGQLIWQAPLPAQIDNARLALTPDGHVLVVGGTTVVGSWLREFDANGQLVLLKEYPTTLAGALKLNDVASDAQGRPIITGMLINSFVVEGSSHSSAGYSDPFIMKLNAADSVQWYTQGGGPGAMLAETESGSGVVVNASGDVFAAVSGNGWVTYGSITVQGDDGVDGQETYLLKLDSMGFVQGVLGSGYQTLRDFPLSVELGTNDRLFVGGSLMTTDQPGPTFGGTSVIGLTALQNWDLYVAEVGDLSTAILAPSDRTAPLIFPNPTSGEITITRLPAQGQLHLRDAQGRSIRSAHITGTEIHWTLTDLPAGYYQIELQGRSERSVTRLIKL